MRREKDAHGRCKVIVHEREREIGFYRERRWLGGWER